MFAERNQRGDVEDALDTLLDRGLEKQLRAADVRGLHPLALRARDPNCGNSAEMKHNVASLHCGTDCGALGEAALHELAAAVDQLLGSARRASEPNDGVAALE